jgi:drug/metabolite transporter (DMT)-like permease
MMATGPLWCAAFSTVFLKETVPRHSWVASLICTGFVGLIYAGSMDAQGTHILGTAVALLVPMALGGYWVLCKSSPAHDMVPALALSGLIGPLLSLVVIFGDAGGGDGGRGLHSSTFQLNLSRV